MNRHIVTTSILSPPCRRRGGGGGTYTRGQDEAQLVLASFWARVDDDTRVNHVTVEEIT